MLAQNFKSAADLGITEVEQRALVTVLYMLEQNKIAPYYNRSAEQDALYMGAYFASDRELECGTIACLCGWAHKVSHKAAFPELNEVDQSHATDLLSARLPRKAQDLFWINTGLASEPSSMESVATALRSYLTTGDARWDLAVA